MDVIPNRLRLLLREEGFTTELYENGTWRAGSSAASRPVDALAPAQVTADGFAGVGDGFTWVSRLSAAHGGVRVQTTVTVTQMATFAPSMVLWVAALDSLDDRQAHTWRQTVLRAPTVNAGGLGGNDLPACYLYDHATRTETICYWPPDAFAWTARRFCEWQMREVIRYRPDARYGLGLQPATPAATVTLESGTYRFEWWFTQRARAAIPTPWEAQQALIEAVAPLLDPTPRLMADALPWREMAERTLADLHDDACWITVDGVTGLRAYVRDSSAVGRDKARGFELMTQLDVLYPLLVRARLTGDAPPDDLVDRLLATLPHFDRAMHDFVANGYPPRANDTFMDTWYFLENALIKLPWVAHLTGWESLKAMFRRALTGARQLAHQCNDVFPLFADAVDWQMRGSLLNPGVGGLYAAGCVMGWQLFGERDWLDEAARALRTMHRLPPHLLTHEPQQLSFGAAAAAYLARELPSTQPVSLSKRGLADPAEARDEWAAMVDDLVRLSLRMGYWGPDATAPQYDPRGMFQACASLCYPAYKENVETLLAWSELLRADSTVDVGLARLMATFANLQRCHNYAFFDAWLPEGQRRGPCAFIPYEDVATAEFPYTATLGKELYGAGEVLWSALLFDALGQVDVDNADVLCMSLNVPTLNLNALADETRDFLIYNPAGTARQVTVTTPFGARDIALEPHGLSRLTVSNA